MAIMASPKSSQGGNQGNRRVGFQPSRPLNSMPLVANQSSNNYQSPNMMRNQSALTQQDVSPVRDNLRTSEETMHFSPQNRIPGPHTDDGQSQGGFSNTLNR